MLWVFNWFEFVCYVGFSLFGLVVCLLSAVLILFAVRLLLVFCAACLLGDWRFLWFCICCGFAILVWGLCFAFLWCRFCVACGDGPWHSVGFDFWLMLLCVGLRCEILPFFGFVSIAF